MNDDVAVEGEEVREALLLDDLCFSRLCHLHYLSGFSYQAGRQSRCFMIKKKKTRVTEELSHLPRASK